jgi:hypothetical protein
MAKAITVQTTQLKDVTLNFDPDSGELKVVVLLHLIDDAGDKIKDEVWIREFGAMTAGLQSDINGLMREISQEVNNTYANDDSNTWIDL